MAVCPKTNDKTIWGSSREELLEKDPNCLPKSVSFVASTVHDNKILLDKDQRTDRPLLENRQNVIRKGCLRRIGSKNYRDYRQRALHFLEYLNFPLEGV